MNTFGYDHITKQAEKTISECMEKAQEGVATGDHLQYIDWAYGAFRLWADITKTHGDQQPRDFERLVGLTTVGLTTDTKFRLTTELDKR
jgi:hypothetical protein